MFCIENIWMNQTWIPQQLSACNCYGHKLILILRFSLSCAIPHINPTESKLIFTSAQHFCKCVNNIYCTRNHFKLKNKSNNPPGLMYAGPILCDFESTLKIIFLKHYYKLVHSSGVGKTGIIPSFHSTWLGSVESEHLPL